MNKTEIIELLTVLEDVQKDCSPITVSIGYTVDNMVYHDGVIIKEACNAVIKRLVAEGYLMSLTSDGIIIIAKL